MNTQNTYAVIEDGFVENIIIADSLEIANQVSGKTCVYIDSNTRKLKNIYIGCQYDGSDFIEDQPYPSWTLNQETKIWEPPVKRPDDYESINDSKITLYMWDEESISWLRHEQPVNIIQ